MSDYWIKLYHEILDDPKMAVLPDRLWRRVIELFLMAGRLRKEGLLPETNQIAWMLRMPTDDLSHDLQQIASTGIIEKQIDGWLIKQFAKRQAAVPAKERMAQMREREQKQQYYDNVTEQLRNVTQITDNRSDNRLQITDQIRSEAEVRPVLFSMYEREIGVITQRMAETLIQAEKDYPLEWFIDAFKEAVDHNARNWKYVEAILRRWQSQGKKDLPEKKNGKVGEKITITLPGGETTEIIRQ